MPIPVQVRVSRHGMVETFPHAMPDESKESLEAVVDYFEGHIGTVLSIYADDRRLYKALIEAWELKKGK